MLNKRTILYDSLNIYAAKAAGYGYQLMKTKVLFALYVCRYGYVPGIGMQNPASLANAWRCCIPKQKPKCSQMLIAQTKEIQLYLHNLYSNAVTCVMSCPPEDIYVYHVYPILPGGMGISISFSLPGNRNGHTSRERLRCDDQTRCFH